GLDEAWLRDFAGREKENALDARLRAFAAWLLCVEYVHDLRRLPHLVSLQRLAELPKPLVSVATELLSQLRAQHGDAYARLANDVETFVAAELEQMSADDLGDI